MSSRLVVVPNYLKDAINKKLDEVFKSLPQEAQKDRGNLYNQLLQAVDKYGYIPEFKINY